MPTNREMLNERGIEDILITLERGRRNHDCVINSLTSLPDAAYTINRKCYGKCEICILKWLDESAVVLPMKEEEK